MSLSDKDLLSALNVSKHQNNKRYNILAKEFTYIEKELKRHGVTLELLWQEYKDRYPDGYGYSQYCHHYYQWKKSQDVSMHIEHKAGDKLYVDYAGKQIPVVDPHTGEIENQEVFVGVLGCSHYSYIEARPSQQIPDWTYVNGNTFNFLGGVTKAIVPDCLKSAVTKSDKYEPEINETYQDFARHYGTVILPARVLKPKDYVNCYITEINRLLRTLLVMLTGKFMLPCVTEHFIPWKICSMISKKKNLVPCPESNMNVKNLLEEGLYITIMFICRKINTIIAHLIN